MSTRFYLETQPPNTQNTLGKTTKSKTMIEKLGQWFQEVILTLFQKPLHLHLQPCLQSYKIIFSQTLQFKNNSSLITPIPLKFMDNPRFVKRMSLEIHHCHWCPNLCPFLSFDQETHTRYRPHNLLYQRFLWFLSKH